MGIAAATLGDPTDGNQVAIVPVDQLPSTFQAPADATRQMDVYTAVSFVQARMRLMLSNIFSNSPPVVPDGVDGNAFGHDALVAESSASVHVDGGVLFTAAAVPTVLLSASLAEPPRGVTEATPPVVSGTSDGVGRCLEMILEELSIARTEDKVPQTLAFSEGGVKDPVACQKAYTQLRRLSLVAERERIAAHALRELAADAEKTESAAVAKYVEHKTELGETAVKLGVADKPVRNSYFQVCSALQARGEAPPREGQGCLVEQAPHLRTSKQTWRKLLKTNSTLEREAAILVRSGQFIAKDVAGAADYQIAQTEAIKAMPLEPADAAQVYRLKVNKAQRDSGGLVAEALGSDAPQGETETAQVIAARAIESNKKDSSELLQQAASYRERALADTNAAIMAVVQGAKDL